MGYLWYSRGKVAEKAEFTMNKFNIATQREIAEISIFLLGEEPLLSVSRIAEVTANALKAKKA